MSYKYETQYNSPNFTPGADVPKVWGRPFERKNIAIHWWGDPNTGPSYEGVIRHLSVPGNASAHFVVTGTGRRAAQLVDFTNASWATNSANPYTISLELDPRARDEDYDVAAEVIAQIWSAFHYMPLVPHRQFVATACPGNYDLGRLEALAKTKDGSGDWGDVKNKVTNPPVVTPPATDDKYRVMHGDVQKAAYSSEQNAYNGWVQHGSTGSITFKGQNVTEAIVNKYKPPVVVPDPVDPTPEPENPKPEEPKPATTLWDDIVKLWNKLVEFLKKYKRS